MTQPRMRWNICLDKWNIMPLSSNVTLFCVIFCSRCFLSLTRCLYSEFRKNHSVSCIRCVSMAQWGAEFLNGKRKCKYLVHFWICSFILIQKNYLIIIQVGRSQVYIQATCASVCVCVCIYIYTHTHIYTSVLKKNSWHK